MPRPPGLPKTGGRKKGTPNRRKEYDLVKALHRAGIDPLAELLKLLPEVKPDQRAKIWLRIVLAIHEPNALEDAAEMDAADAPVSDSELTAALAKTDAGIEALRDKARQTLVDPVTKRSPTEARALAMAPILADIEARQSQPAAAQPLRFPR